MKVEDGTISRRGFVAAGAALSLGAVHLESRLVESAPHVRVTGFDLLPVRASERTVWLIVRLRTNAGLTGLGEASDAFGYAATTRQDAARMEAELRGFFGLINGRSPLEINHYRARSAPLIAKVATGPST